MSGGDANCWSLIVIVIVSLYLCISSYSFMYVLGQVLDKFKLTLEYTLGQRDTRVASHFHEFILMWYSEINVNINI